MSEYLVESLIADLTQMATMATLDGPTPNGEVLRRARAKIEALQSELSALKAESEWISVDDRWPDDQRAVIVSGGTAYCDGGVWYTFLERYDDLTCRPIQWTVTHWKPLPSIPVTL